MVRRSTPSAVVDFLDQDYCYISVTTQILHSVELALICPAGDRTQNYCIKCSDFASVPIATNIIFKVLYSYSFVIGSRCLQRALAVICHDSMILKKFCFSDTSSF